MVENDLSKGDVMGMTESLTKTETILNRIAWLSEQNKDKYLYAKISHAQDQNCASAILALINR